MSKRSHALTPVTFNVAPRARMYVQVKRYFYESEKIETIFVDFSERNAHVVDLSTHENKLECTYTSFLRPSLCSLSVSRHNAPYLAKNHELDGCRALDNDVHQIRICTTNTRSFSRQRLRNLSKITGLPFESSTSSYERVLKQIETIHCFYKSSLRRLSLMCSCK